MTTFTDVFERKEVKYRLERAPAPRDGSRVTRSHGTRRVRPDGASSAATSTRPSARSSSGRWTSRCIREKLRLRSYGSPQAGDRVFVEIKKKYKGHRVQATGGLLVGCGRSLPGRRVVRAGLRADSAARPGDGRRVAVAAQREIAREVDEFIARYRPLRPSMLIECERVAYASIATIAAAAGGGATDLRALGESRTTCASPSMPASPTAICSARDAGAASHPLLPTAMP